MNNKKHESKESKPSSKEKSPSKSSSRDKDKSSSRDKKSRMGKSMGDLDYKPSDGKKHDKKHDKESKESKKSSSKSSSRLHKSVVRQTVIHCRLEIVSVPQSLIILFVVVVKGGPRLERKGEKIWGKYFSNLKVATENNLQKTS